MRGHAEHQLGHNRELLGKCKKLEEYARFIDQIRQYLSSGLDRESAVTTAVEFCIESGILRDLLIQHKAEVMDMLLTEYNEELVQRELFEQGLEEGMSKGRMEGMAEGILKSKREDILEILYSLGDVSEELRQLIAHQSDLDVLKGWLLSAVAASSISEFAQSSLRPSDHNKTDTAV